MKVRKVFAVLAVVATGAVSTAGSAAVTSTDMESYAVGTIHNQDGWLSAGAAGSGCAVYDHKVVDNSDATGYDYPSLGDRSLRMSNAVTSGCFGDQTFSKPSPEAAGETTSDPMGSPIAGAHYDASWDFASTVPGAQQPGLSVVASPDRGDGARMSWIQMADGPNGLEVNFYEYDSGANEEGCETGSNFVFSNLVTNLDRDEVHRIRVVMDFFEGPDNDVVKVYVDGVLQDPNDRGYTGGSWEGYFRECEGNPSRSVDSILFRTGGGAAPGTLGNGLLVDNLRLRTFEPTTLEAHPFIGVGVPPDADLTLSATLLEEDETPVVGREIVFSAGATVICTGETDASGVATCAPSPEGLVAMALQQGYLASFAGDADYEPATREGRLIA